VSHSKTSSIGNSTALLKDALIFDDLGRLLSQALEKVCCGNSNAGTRLIAEAGTNAASQLLSNNTILVDWQDIIFHGGARVSLY
jgi:hypothetical protein